MRVYNDGNFIVSYPDETAFADNKYFIAVKRLREDAVRLTILEIDASYTIFDDDEFNIDLSDYAKSNSPGSVTVSLALYGADDAVLSTFVFDSTLYAGAYTNDEIYPLESYLLCMDSDVQPVMVKMHVSVMLEKANGETWETVRVISAGEWFNGQLGQGTYRLTSTTPGFEERRFTIDVIRECDKDEYIPVTWTGENGFGKKWLFKKVGEIRNTVDAVELARLNDGYTIHKGKTVQLQVAEENTDVSTRKYLADIVYSSNVDTFYITPTNERVNVPITVGNSSTTVDLLVKDADFSITLNVAQYDNF